MCVSIRRKGRRYGGRVYTSPHYMAFIQPDNNIRLLKGVPLDENYVNTLYFTSKGEQYSAFSSKIYKTYNNATYIRERNRVRIPDGYDNVIMCNYLMYQNHNFSDKWFYAFIIGVYYINDNMTEIEFKLDVMQTWITDYSIPPCYVERCHTETDDIGQYVLDENLSMGEYVVCQSSADISNFSRYNVVMYSTFDPSTLQSNGGTLTSGVYSALTRTIIGQIGISKINNSSQNITASFTTDPRPVIQDIINNHADLVDGIVAIVLSPDITSVSTWTLSKPGQGSSMGMGGGEQYVPKNRRLYSYPYSVLYVTDGQGGGKTYKYEDFNGLQPIFKLVSDKTPNENIIIAPCDYGGTRPSYNVNFNEAIILSGFPQCAWVSDAYKTYLAQNQANLGLQAVIGAGQVVGGIAMAAAGATTGVGALAGSGLITSGLSSITNMITDLSDKSRQAPKAQGSCNNTVFYSCGVKAPKALMLTPKAEYVKIIDDYFTRFGYKVCRIETPKRDARPYFTYIKTIDCNIQPTNGLPASDMRAIEDIYNKGITFWKHMSYVGNYNLNNTV